MDIAIDTDLFPKLRDAVRAHWAPVFFEPISGSYERFVVGVAVFNSDGFHLEWANQLARLKCFYGEDAVGAVQAIEIAGEYLRDDLAQRGPEAISKPDPAVSGIAFGIVSEVEGVSLAAIGSSWMTALSSLYIEPLNENAVSKVAAGLSAAGQGAGDRLPFLVCDYVKDRREGFAGFFSADLREGRQKRMKGTSHKVIIDFSGSKLVANFGTLKAGSLTGSVNLIKRRLWDLKVERDREPGSNFTRQHEMILQRPSEDDPQVTDKQQANLEEAFKELEHQADQEELRLRALGTVQQIGEHILKAEAA
ncbi:hypothetical protein [Tateyamaria sp. ANG-S1]|uniref:hypothetical protein n=1 Tax=Tateyamaria sp. ANG-S1 TaxID=1577905 RepID=UPI00057D654D|nr:hypothetical protein [Tateyamaria sp. ANG-S1]KIC48389.1 hypothetical protein RA29_11465 [Tateyamaria sp. ANG-S1]